MSSTKEELTSAKLELIAPCLQKGISIAQRSRETGCHRSTISRALARYHKEGSSSFERKPRQDKGSFQVTPELEELIKAHLIALPNLSCRTVLRMVERICIKKSWPVPSYSVIYRIQKSLPHDLLTLSKDSAEYRRLYELIHRFEASCPNELWQADHNFMDIFVWDDTGQALRPILTIILDDYTRAVTGYYLDFVPPSAQRTALALRHAIWHKNDDTWPVCGIPEKLYTDRGADFTSKRLQQISLELEFELIKGRPYYPQGKGKIERFFETMNQLLLCDLPGYTAEGMPPQQPGLSIKEFRRVFHKWLIDEYMHHVNEDTGESPATRWGGKPPVPRMPASIDALHMLLMTISDQRKVHKDGIHTLNLRYMNTDLQLGYIGEHVVVRYDPSDVSRVYVFHENKFVCTAVCTKIEDLRPSYDDIKEARISRKKDLRSTISAAKALVNAHASDSARPIPPETETEVSVPTGPAKQAKPIRRYSVDE